MPLQGLAALLGGYAEGQEIRRRREQQQRREAEETQRYEDERAYRRGQDAKGRIAITPEIAQLTGLPAGIEIPIGVAAQYGSVLSERNREADLAGKQASFLSGGPQAVPPQAPQRPAMPPIGMPFGAVPGIGQAKGQVPLPAPTLGREGATMMAMGAPAQPAMAPSFAGTAPNRTGTEYALTPPAPPQPVALPAAAQSLPPFDVWAPAYMRATGQTMDAAIAEYSKLLVFQQNREQAAKAQGQNELRGALVGARPPRPSSAERDPANALQNLYGAWGGQGDLGPVLQDFMARKPGPVAAIPQEQVVALGKQYGLSAADALGVWQNAVEQEQAQAKATADLAQTTARTGDLQAQTQARQPVPVPIGGTTYQVPGTMLGSVLPHADRPPVQVPTGKPGETLSLPERIAGPAASAYVRSTVQALSPAMQALAAHRKAQTAEVAPTATVKRGLDTARTDASQAQAALSRTRAGEVAPTAASQRRVNDTRISKMQQDMGIDLTMTPDGRLEPLPVPGATLTPRQSGKPDTWDTVRTHLEAYDEERHGTNVDTITAPDGTKMVLKAGQDPSWKARARAVLQKSGAKTPQAQKAARSMAEGASILGSRFGGDVLAFSRYSRDTKVPRREVDQAIRHARNGGKVKLPQWADGMVKAATQKRKVSASARVFGRKDYQPFTEDAARSIVAATIIRGAYANWTDEEIKQAAANALKPR